MSDHDTSTDDRTAPEDAGDESVAGAAETDGGTVAGEREPRRNGLLGPGPDERPHPEERRNAQGIRIDPETEAEPAVREAILSALVANEPGVLSRVAGLFTRRQFNIEGLTVGPTQERDMARITLVIEEPEPSIEQAKKQLEKLVPVVSVTELSSDAITRELALIKVAGEHPDQVAAVADMYDATVVDSTGGTVTVEVTGAQQKVEAAIETFQRFDLIELKRTGTAALERGAQLTDEPHED